MSGLNDSKLIRFLRVIDPKDLNPLIRFSNASLVHEDPRISKLLEWILDHQSKNKTAVLDKIQAFRSVFGKSSYNDTDMRVLMTKALQTVLAFISLTEFQKDPIKQETEVISFLNQIKADDLLEKKIKDLEAGLGKCHIRNDQFYLHQLELEEARYNLVSRFNQEYDYTRIFASLNSFYFYLKLKYSCLRINTQYIYQHPIEPAFLKEITDNLKLKIQDNPAIRCYSHVLFMQIGEDSHKHLISLQKILEKHAESIDEDDLRILSKFAENYCIRQINKGLREYYHVLYELMTDRFRREKKIYVSEFKNFITTCLRSEKAGEVLTFIKHNKNRIFPEEIRADAVNYAMARYYFHMKDYNGVLNLLQQVSYFDEFYKIDSKKLLIQTFYELREWDSLESAMNAFRVFIHRNKAISEVHKLNNQNFINLLFQLVSVPGGASKKIAKLQQAVVKTEALAEREWLLQKISDLENSRKVHARYLV